MEATDAIIRAAFPEHPVPTTFFGVERPQQDDIWLELASRIQGRVWTSLSLLDWRMTGVSPGTVQGYLVPKALAYYVPSFLIGAILEPDFRDLAFGAILPNNQWRRPRGEWWMSFAAAFTDPQRVAIRTFLAYERKADGFTFDLVDEELVSAAENLWT